MDLLDTDCQDNTQAFLFLVHEISVLMGVIFWFFLCLLIDIEGMGSESVNYQNLHQHQSYWNI